MVGLVDCNNFFVSCERIFAPALEGRPVAVLSNNDGVVVARSKELKALGIPMGEPYFKLKQIADLYGIVFKSSNYELYADISRRVMAVLRESSPLVEQYSIDEGFLHITLSNDDDYVRCAEMLRHKIWHWVGIPVGVGFAQTRTLAKIANHIAKHTEAGTYVMLKPDMEVLDTVPVDEVWGVGYRSAKKLKGIGIRTAADLARMPHEEARKRFSVCLLRTIYELNGEQASLPDDLDTPSKSATCSRAFGAVVTSVADLRESIAQYADNAARRIRDMGTKATGCNIFFEYCPEYSPVKLDGGFTGRSILFKRPTSNTSEILSQVLPVVPKSILHNRRYRKSGITLWGMDTNPAEQLELFDPPPKPPIPDKLYKTLDAINLNYGKNTIHTLAEGLAPGWKMKRSLLSQRYTTSWDELPVVLCK